MVPLTVNNCSCARLEHFANFQKRKSKFSENQKRHLSHAVGRKTKREKEEEEKKRKEQVISGSVSGNGGPNEGKDNGKKKDESPQETKDEGKGKAKARNEEQTGEVQDEASQERTNKLQEREEDEMRKATSQWRWEVLVGKMKEAEKIGEEKWKGAMEAGTSGGRTND